MAATTYSDYNNSDLIQFSGQYNSSRTYIPHDWHNSENSGFKIIAANSWHKIEEIYPADIKCYQDTTQIYFALIDGFCVLPLSGKVRIQLDDNPQYEIIHEFKSNARDTLKVVRVSAQANVPSKASYFINDTKLDPVYHWRPAIITHPCTVTVRFSGRGISSDFSEKLEITQANFDSLETKGYIKYDYKITNYRSEFPVCIWNWEDKYDTNFYGFRTPLSGIGVYHSVNGAGLALVSNGFTMTPDGFNDGDGYNIYLNGIFASTLMINTTYLNGIGFSIWGTNAYNINGFSFGYLTSLCHNLNGIQIGGLSSGSDVMNGLQFGGIGTRATSASGIVIAGLINNSYKFNGLQIGSFNAAEDIFGMHSKTGQSAEDEPDIKEGITGVQIGAVNLTKSLVGVQIGLVNVTSELNGIQIGVLNFNKQSTLRFMPLINMRF